MKTKKIQKATFNFQMWDIERLWSKLFGDKTSAILHSIFKDLPSGQ